MALVETGDRRVFKVDSPVDVDVGATATFAGVVVSSGPPAVAVLGWMGEEVNVGMPSVLDILSWYAEKPN